MIEGGCYCGATRYQVTGDPVFKAQCHCRECQYYSGGGPNYFMTVPADGFAYTKGTPARFARPDLENAVTREFCPNCGTGLATQLFKRKMVVVKIGTFDDPAAFKTPRAAIYTIDQQPFHLIPEGMPSFERLPG